MKNLQIWGLLNLTRGLESDDSFYTRNSRRNLGHDSSSSRSSYAANYYVYDSYYYGGSSYNYQSDTTLYVDRYNYLTGYTAPTTYVAPTPTTTPTTTATTTASSSSKPDKFPGRMAKVTMTDEYLPDPCFGDWTLS